MNKSGSLTEYRHCLNEHTTVSTQFLATGFWKKRFRNRSGHSLMPRMESLGTFLQQTVLSAHRPQQRPRTRKRKRERRTTPTYRCRFAPPRTVLPETLPALWATPLPLPPPKPLGPPRLGTVGGIVNRRKMAQWAIPHDFK